MKRSGCGGFACKLHALALISHFKEPLEMEAPDSGGMEVPRRSVRCRFHSSQHKDQQDKVPLGHWQTKDHLIHHRLPTAVNRRLASKHSLATVQFIRRAGEAFWLAPLKQSDFQAILNGSGGSKRAEWSRLGCAWPSQSRSAQRGPLQGCTRANATTRCGLMGDSEWWGSCSRQALGMLVLLARRPLIGGHG
jgi:hypothetical protein